MVPAGIGETKELKEIYRIADKIISIESIYDLVHEYCREYRIPEEEWSGPCDITVTISAADLEAERMRSGNDTEAGEEYLEELAVYRKIAEAMVPFDTFLFHGSCVAVDGSAYLFTAKSGVGKSTHAKLWCDLLGERAVMVNDDKPLIHVKEEADRNLLPEGATEQGQDWSKEDCQDSNVIVYGTPYNGKHRRGSNIAVPLKAICVLERADTNSIEETGGSEIFPILLQQAFRPEEKALYAHTIGLIGKMSGRLKFYRLHCNMDIEAAEIAVKKMVDLK